MKNKTVDGIHAPHNNDNVFGWLFVGFMVVLFVTVVVSL
jgi:hypothetical protein